MAWTATIQSIDPEGDHLIAELAVSDGSVTFTIDVRLHVDWTAAQAAAGIKEHLERNQPAIARAKQAQVFVGQSINLK